MWACDSLGDVISRDSTASPVDAVYLVCHSHGGTVAIDCLLKHGARLAAEGISLKGLLSLATPFIIRVPRTDDDRGPRLTLLAAFFAPILFTLYLALGRFDFDPLDPNWLSFLIFGSLSSILFSGGLALILEGMARKSKTADPRNEAQVKLLPPIHILRMTGDEASGFLIFTSFLSWLNNRLLSRCSSIT
jgi:hypothetical protein